MDEHRIARKLRITCDTLYTHALMKVSPSIRKFSISALVHNNAINAAIRQYLCELLQRTGASRASLVNLHNGGHDAVGVSYLKFSIVHEITDGKADTRKSTPLGRNVDLASRPELLAALLRDNPITVTRMHDKNKGPAERYALEHNITCAVITHAIRFKKYGIQRLYGCVMLDYVDSLCGCEAGSCLTGSEENLGALRKCAALVESKLRQRI